MTDKPNTFKGALIDIVKGALSDADEPATKGDLAELETRIERLIDMKLGSIRADIVSVVVMKRKALSAQIDSLRPIIDDQKSNPHAPI